MRSRGGDERSQAFEQFYTARYTEIAGYVRRRVTGDAADDVVASIFAVAWRRLDHIPVPPDDRLWLFGVARNAVADYNRSQHRQLALRLRLAQDVVTADRRQEPDGGCEHVLAALSTLRPADREALQLVLWDELSHAEAAAVMRCSIRAFESRYRRARHAVRAAVAGIRSSPGLDPVSSPRTATAREAAS